MNKSFYPIIFRNNVAVSGNGLVLFCLCLKLFLFLQETRMNVLPLIPRVAHLE